MADRSTTGPRARYRTWLTTLALAATFPLAIATPVAAQEQPAADPMEIMRQEFDACIARGEEGSDCAALAKLTLDIIMAGGTVTAGGTTPDTSQDDASVSGTDQVTTSGGQDGQRSSGGDQSVSGEPTGEQAPPAETTGEPAPTGDTGQTSTGDQAPATDGSTPPPTDSTAPPADMTQPGSTTTTTTTTSDGTNTGSTSTLSGGTQSDVASGADGRRRARD